MENELTIRLEQPIEELIPQMISWNNEELLARVQGVLKQYDGVEYTDSEIGEAKKDRAKLNAFATALNNERIRVSKIYSAPYDKFKAQVDEVVNAVKSVSNKIGDRVKEYDEKQRQARYNRAYDLYLEILGEYAELLPFDRIASDKWLLSSATKATVSADLEKLKADIESAVAVIEELHSPDEATIKAFYFRTLNLGQALAENKRLQEERARAEQILRAKENSEKPNIPEATVQAQKVEMPQEQPQVVSIFGDDELTTVSFEVKGTIAQLKALKQFLTENNIRYNKI